MAFFTLHELAGVTSTTEFELQIHGVQGRGLFLFDATELVGRWNVTVDYRRDNRALELARASGILAPGIYPLIQTHPMDDQNFPFVEPSHIRYFTTSPNASIKGKLLLVSG